MTGAVYTKKDFDLSNNPQVTPEIVEAAIKLQYRKNLIGKNLLGFQSIPVSTVSTNEEGETEGDVNWLSESGSLPKLDFTFTRGTKRVRPYGGYFEVTEEQVEDGLEDEIRTRSRTLPTPWPTEDLMAERHHHRQGVLTVDAKNQGCGFRTDAGDPLYDIQAAIRMISGATKRQKPDTIIMSELTFGYLTGFDVIKNRLYNTQGKDGYTVTGEVPTLLGKRVIIDDAVDPLDVGQVVVMKAKDVGVWQERYPLRTRSIEGALLGKDNIAYKITAKAKGEPNIKHPELACLIQGIYSEGS